MKVGIAGSILTLPTFSSIIGSVKIVIKVLVVNGIVTSLLGLLDAQPKGAFTDAEYRDTILVEMETKSSYAQRHQSR